MNVLLTSRCNRRCPYCFAAERISYGDSRERAGPAPTFISDEDYGFALEFARRSQHETIGVLGGEPSLHPRFPALLEQAWTAGLRTRVFSNGLWREPQIEAVKEAAARHPDHLQVIVNVNEPDITPADEATRQAGTLAGLGQSCTLSFNLYRTDARMGFLLELIEMHRLRRHIRLGLAQPLAGGASACIPVEQYRDAAAAVLELAAGADARDVTIGFDCGFTLCMFTDEQLGTLWRAGVTFRASCGPAIDVGTDLSVWACFPLATLSQGASLREFRDLRHLEQHFRERYGRLYRTGALEACIDCKYLRRRQCDGGCAAHVYRSVAA